MNLLKFEIKKILKQKKLYWILAIVLLVTSGIFIQNTLEKKSIDTRALEEFEPFVFETEEMGERLRLKQLEDVLSETEEKQYEHIKEISTAFFHWKRSVREELWEDIPTYENDFLTHVEELENHGGVYSPLQGIAREKRIAKNDWMIENNLGYEDEAFPTSPHLLLKENTKILFGVLGVVILLLFFGNYISMEKEQNTWLTLNTQPIPNWKLFVGKYVSILFTTLIYLIMVIVIGLFIPVIFGDYSLHLLYPQIVTAGGDFAFISTFHYISRAIMLFICATAITFSTVMFISKWFKNTFTTLILSGFILIVGYMLTELYESLQSVWNPFQTFHMATIIETIPQNTDWLYVLITFLWVLFFVSLTIFLPNKEILFFRTSDLKKPFQKGVTKKQSKQLLSSMKFEARKTKRSGILSQASIFTLLLMILGFVVLHLQTTQKENTYIDELHETVKEIKNDSIPFFEDRVKENEQQFEEEDNVDYQIAAQNMKEALEFVEKELILINEAIEGYENDDWLPLLEYQLHKNKLLNGDYETSTGNLGSTLWTSVSSLTLEASIAEKHWLMERNIRPIFSGEFINTIFHNWSSQWGDNHDFGKEWEARNKKIDATGLYSLYYSFNIFVYLIPIILLLFLFGGGLAEERGKQDTIRFLKTQPVSKRSLFTGKFVYSMGISLISSIGFILFVLFIGTIFNRFGDWNYPILHYDSQSIAEAANYTGSRPFAMEVGYHFMPLGEVLLKNVSLFLCILVFILTIAQVLSLWFKNKLTVIASTVMFSVIGYVISAKVLVNKTHLSPFTYFDISRITNGEIATVLNNPSVNVQYGVAILLVSTGIMLLIGYISLIKQRN